jgi:hypothetical protein
MCLLVLYSLWQGCRYKNYLKKRRIREKRNMREKVKKGGRRETKEISKERKNR